MAATITHKDILSANAAGLADRVTGDWVSYYTPTLNAAYLLGQEGVDLSDAPVVTGYRYGKAPSSYISTNYADQRGERGLSLAAINGEKEIASSMWFRDREIHEYTGILAGRGSDGEAIILCLSAENHD